MKINLLTGSALNICVSIVLLTGFTYGQPDKKHQIGFQLGLGKYSSRDNLVSPLMYSGYRLPVQLYYVFNGSDSRHSVQISFSRGRVRSSVYNSADELVAGFRYEYHRLISPLTNRGAMYYFGGAWDNYFLERQYYFTSYIPDNPDYTETDTWELVSSLNLSFIVEYPLQRESRFIVQTVIPVIANVLRPTYSLLPPDNILMLKDPASPGPDDVFRAGHIVTLNKYFLVDLSLGYEIKTSSSVKLKWGYSLTYYRISHPIKTSTVINNFSMDVIFLF